MIPDIEENELLTLRSGANRTSSTEMVERHRQLDVQVRVAPVSGSTVLARDTYATGWRTAKK